MSCLNSVTLVGFVGADPEQRQSRSNGSKFTVLSVPRSAPGRLPRENGPLRPSGIASASFVRDWPIMSQRRSRRARMSS